MEAASFLASSCKLAVFTQLSQIPDSRSTQTPSLNGAVEELWGNILQFPQHLIKQGNKFEPLLSGGKTEGISRIWKPTKLRLSPRPQCRRAGSGRRCPLENAVGDDTNLFLLLLHMGFFPCVRFTSPGQLPTPKKTILKMTGGLGTRCIRNTG